MAYSVSTAAIVCIWLVLALCAALIIVPFVLVRKKYKPDWFCFIVGALIFVFFAIGLETAPKQLFVAELMSVPSPKMWLVALVSALMAGLFEETGRFFAFSVLLKKRRGNDGNALMYGLGHGGCEIVMIVMFSMVNNLVYAAAMNAGTVDSLLTGLDEANAAAVQVALGQLADAKPAMFFISVIERIAALSGHIALSVVVWAACKVPGKKWLFPCAILLHTYLDFVPGLCSLNGVPMWIVELFVYLCAALCVVVAIRVWKTVLNKKEEPAASDR